MNRLQKAIASLIGIKQAPLLSGSNYSYINGSLVWMADNQASFVQNGYGNNDIVYSGVNLVTDKARVPEWELYKVVDEAAMKKYKTAIKNNNYKEAKKWKRKSLEELTTFNSKTGKWAELLQWPNENETFQDIVANGIAYKMLTGNKFLYGELLQLGANAGVPNELFLLPSQYMTIIATLGFPNRTVGYKLMQTEILNFDKSLVLHEKFFNPEYHWQGSHLYGQSPLKAAIKNLTRNNYAKTASASKFENRGADGVIFVDDQRMSNEEGMEQIAAVKRILANDYSGPGNSGKIAAAGYKVGYQKIGESVVDLDIINAEDLDLRRLFNIWGIPSQLGNDPANKTYNNQKEAEKALTTRCVLPQMESFKNHLNRMASTYWGLQDQNVYIDYDSDCFDELQEDKAAKWQWVKELPVPEAYKLELMDLDVPADLPKDLMFIDSNKVSLQEFMASQQDAILANITDDSGMIDYESGQPS